MDRSSFDLVFESWMGQIEKTFWNYPTLKETGNGSGSGTGSTEPDAIPSDTDEFPTSCQMIKDVKMVRNGKSHKKKNKTVNTWSDGQVFTAANIKKKRQIKGMYFYFVPVAFYIRLAQ